MKALLRVFAKYVLKSFCVQCVDRTSRQDKVASEESIARTLVKALVLRGLEGYKWYGRYWR